MGYTFGGGVKFAHLGVRAGLGAVRLRALGQPDAPRDAGPRRHLRLRGLRWRWRWRWRCSGGELLADPHDQAPAFWAARRVVPVVALAYLLHGVFLLTSIGIGIEKKAGYYPLITRPRRPTNVAANFVLIPRHGMMGAAWATVLSYAVMAALGAYLSHRVYPLPLEKSRLLRLVVSAALSFTLSTLVGAASPLTLAALWPVLGWKTAACLVFPFAVVATGFLRPDERAYLRRLASR